MLQTTINGYKVLIFKTYNGNQLFIIDRKGNQLYAHRVTESPVQRAKQIIDGLSEQTSAPAQEMKLAA